MARMGQGPVVPKDMTARQFPVPPGRRGPGGVGAALTDGGALAPVALPPAFFQPDIGTPFYREGQATLGPGPATWVVPAALVFTLPPHAMGVLRVVTFYVNNMVATTALTFNVLVNGAPVSGLGNVPMFPRLAAFVGESFGGAGEVRIPVPSAGRISINASITDGGTYTVGASFYGWFWSAR